MINMTMRLNELESKPVAFEGKKITFDDDD